MSDSSTGRSSEQAHNVEIGENQRLLSEALGMEFEFPEEFVEFQREIASEASAYLIGLVKDKHISQAEMDQITDVWQRGVVPITEVEQVPLIRERLEPEYDQVTALSRTKIGVLEMQLRIAEERGEDVSARREAIAKRQESLAALESSFVNSVAYVHTVPQTLKEDLERRGLPKELVVVNWHRNDTFNKVIFPKIIAIEESLHLVDKSDKYPSIKEMQWVKEMMARVVGWNLGAAAYKNELPETKAQLGDALNISGFSSLYKRINSELKEVLGTPNGLMNMFFGKLDVGSSSILEIQAVLERYNIEGMIFNQSILNNTDTNI